MNIEKTSEGGLYCERISYWMESLSPTIVIGKYHSYTRPTKRHKFVKKQSLQGYEMPQDKIDEFFLLIKNSLKVSVNKPLKGAKR